MNVVGILVYVIWVMVGWLVGGVVFCRWSLPIVFISHAWESVVNYCIYF